MIKEKIKETFSRPSQVVRSKGRKIIESGDTTPE